MNQSPASQHHRGRLSHRVGSAVFVFALAVGAVLGSVAPAHATSVTISGKQPAFDVIHYNTPRNNSFAKNIVTLDPTQTSGGQLTVGLRNASGTQFARASSSGALVSFKTSSGSTAIPGGTFYLNVKLATACGSDAGCGPYSWSAILNFNNLHPGS